VQKQTDKSLHYYNFPLSALTYWLGNSKGIWHVKIPAQHTVKV